MQPLEILLLPLPPAFYLAPALNFALLLLPFVKAGCNTKLSLSRPVHQGS